MSDYIDRERLKEAFNADLQTLQTVDKHTMNLILMEIDEAPAADVAPVVHGRRIKSMPVLGAGNVETHCSVCGRILHEENAPYCYCGAKFAEGND